MVTTRRAWPVLAAAGLLLSSVSVIVLGGGQRAGAARKPAAAAQDTEPPSASLLRRLAAAADGYRTGERVYVVAAVEPPHSVAIVSTSFAQAERVRVRVELELHQRHRTYGPFRTLPDFGRPLIFVPQPRCRPTIWPCYPRGVRPPTPPWPVSDVDSVSIIAYHRSGERWRMTSSLDSLDAVFFSLASIDKFVLPYYAALSGPAYADMLRDSLEAYIRSAPPR